MKRTNKPSIGLRNFSLRSDKTPTIHHVLHIIVSCSYVKMARIYAGWFMASMKNAFTCRDFSVEQLKGVAMGADLAARASQLKYAVSASSMFPGRHNRSQPKPAGINTASWLRNLSPKSFLRWIKGFNVTSATAKQFPLSSCRTRGESIFSFALFALPHNAGPFVNSFWHSNSPQLAFFGIIHPATRERQSW